MAAQLRPVTALGCGISVFGFRVYVAKRFLPVKSSWLAPVTGWPKGTRPVY